MRLLEYYRSGELDTDLREATVAHGFGYLRLTDGEVLNFTAPTFEDFLMPSGCRGCPPDFLSHTTLLTIHVSSS
jgi:hypothetical protein